ncbi:MAG: hypothetical protein B6D56_02765 [Candidatus Omnitrophica bacterium 4484_70.1]|nr:MAG: hypothetical protein B6D56_02765 [Candidatus Omnitrophica bacterium 4484_70.1]
MLNKLRKDYPRIIIAFDLGRVLFNFDYYLFFKKIKDKTKTPFSSIAHALFFEDFALDFEKGLVSGFDFYRKFKKEFKVEIEYSQFVNSWCKIFSPQKEVIELVRKLRFIYPVYLISNINKLHFDYLYRRWKNVFSLFDKLILSFELKSVKPERKIYKRLLSSGISLQDVIYIDDRKDLIEEADNLGLQCIQFQKVGELIKDLRKKGVEIVEERELRQLLKIEKEAKTLKEILVEERGKLSLWRKRKKGWVVIQSISQVESFLKRKKRFFFVSQAKLNSKLRFRFFSSPGVKNFSFLKKERKVDILNLVIESSFFDKGLETLIRFINRRQEI